MIVVAGSTAAGSSPAAARHIAVDWNTAPVPVIPARLILYYSWCSTAGRMLPGPCNWGSKIFAACYIFTSISDIVKSMSCTTGKTS